MTEKYRKALGFVQNNKGDVFDLSEIVDLLNKQEERIKELEEALKQSYLEEICENCEYGCYSESFDYWSCSVEGEFECKKGHDASDCDGLKECDDFKLKY